jgi:hypothetical protein
MSSDVGDGLVEALRKLDGELLADTSCGCAMRRPGRPKRPMEEDNSDRPESEDDPRRDAHHLTPLRCAGRGPRRYRGVWRLDAHAQLGSWTILDHFQGEIVRERPSMRGG